MQFLHISVRVLMQKHNLQITILIISMVMLTVVISPVTGQEMLTLNILHTQLKNGLQKQLKTKNTEQLLKMVTITHSASMLMETGF